MKIAQITNFLETLAPLSYQEDYDNAGLIVGQPQDEVQAALVSLDCTEAVVDEAIAKGCGMIVSHHPIVFKGLKRFNQKNYVERVVMKAIKNNIALYATHTNLDHVQHGVNAEICKRLAIQNPVILSPKKAMLKKLVTFCLPKDVEAIKNALFSAGAGNINNYSECSFAVQGQGTFKAAENANPHVGQIGQRANETEHRIEVIYKVESERQIIVALLEAHPYEEVAYDIYQLDNALQTVGAGMVGNLAQPVPLFDFFNQLKKQMGAKVIRHTQPLAKQMVQKVAVCGGSGSFLLKQAIASGADVFVTADFKYHEFFDAEDKIVIADIGHYETEQFTSNMLIANIQEKFPNFAVYLTEHNTNPINYF